MAITVIGEAYFSDKTNGTSLTFGNSSPGTFNLSVNDLLVVGICHDTAATPSAPTFTGTATGTWTERGTAVFGTDIRTTAWSFICTNAGTCSSINIVHGSLDARAGQAWHVTGAGTYDSGYLTQFATTLSSGTAGNVVSDDSTKVNGSVAFGFAGYEAPVGDSYSFSTADADFALMYSRTSAGTSGGGAASNVTLISGVWGPVNASVTSTICQVTNSTRSADTARVGFGFNMAPEVNIFNISVSTAPRTAPIASTDRWA